MGKMKKFMMGDGRFGMHLYTAVMKIESGEESSIRHSTQVDVQEKSPSSTKLLRFNRALHRHYRTKRLTSLKFELSL